MSERHPVVVKQPTCEHLDDRRAGAPGDVEARHRVSVPACVVAASLGPAHKREGPQATVAQPAALLACREVDVRMCPLARPVVLRPVEARGAQPVLQGQLVTVANTQPALLGTVDEEEAAEGPERLAADVGGVLLVDDQDAAAPFGELTGGDETCKARSDDDDISICHGRQCSGRSGGVGQRGIGPPFVDRCSALVHQGEVDAVEHGLARSRLAQMPRRNAHPHDACAPRCPIGSHAQGCGTTTVRTGSPRRCRAPARGRWSCGPDR